MIIDAHAHAAREYSTVESILEMVKKYKIEKIILCTSVKNILDLKDPPNLPVKKSPNSIFFLNKMLRISYKYFMKDNGDGNAFVFKLKNILPKIIEQFLWLNPINIDHMNNVEKNILYYKPKGIKLHQAWNSFTIDSIEFNKLIDVARSYKLPIFIHLYSKKETRNLLKLIKNNQDIVFIIAHLLGYEILKTERNYLKNIYFDTSGSDRIQGNDILKVINIFGYEHVIFGSDMPFARIDDQIQKIDRLNLSDKIKEHVFNLNIKNLLALN